MAKVKTRHQAKSTHATRHHGPRAFWSGTISFGLVSVPVNLFPANRARSVALRLLDADGTPLRRRFYCPKHERDVHPEHILRGYELPDGEYVIVTDEELESLEPRKTRDIDLTRFVEQSQVPAELFERGYFLTPAGDSTKAYRLLADAMERTGRIGIATFVMRGKEYLIAILAEEGILRAETLRFQDEIRGPDDIGLPEEGKVDSHAVSRFTQTIKNRRADKLNVGELKDEYSERLRALAEKKLKQGEDVVEAEEYQPTDEDVDEEEGDVDLLDTIRRSLHSSNGHGLGNGHARRSRRGHNGHRRQRSAPSRRQGAKQA